ncbi:PIR protein, putative [Plasmodium sp.]|nr:PIR protein, putative [Plasmodium sp.]
MQDKRKQCKEQCDKDIQKIILKDKIQQELTERFFTLHTNIDTNDIPTCVCEKSIEDKTEKVCLNCGKTMGAVAPAWGLVSGLGYVAWTHYVATKVAEEGIKAVISRLDLFPGITRLPGLPLTQIITPGNFCSESLIIETIQSKAVPLCAVPRKPALSFCNFTSKGNDLISKISSAVKEAAEAGKEASAAEGTKLATNTSILSTSIIVSIVAIVVIVLIMVIIYLILRYRRKKK